MDAQLPLKSVGASCETPIEVKGSFAVDIIGGQYFSPSVLL